MNDSMTVSQLNEYTRALLENDILLQMVNVSGEISNFKRHSSGHMYFTLKDDKAKINCSFFKNYNSALRFVPQNGEMVKVSATVSLYPRDGTYQLLVYKMTQQGVGLLNARFEELKVRLSEEGLFDLDVKKPIPQFPKRIAVLASPTGAAVRDIISVSGRRSKNVEIIVVPVPVQGEGAANQIAKALMYADSALDADTIIIARGGGSIEELWAFNEEVLARAVYACKTPVISGVGHETDFTICDYVADLRAATPSAAAEIAVQNVVDIRQAANDTVVRTGRELMLRIESARANANGIMSSAAMASPLRMIRDMQRECDMLHEDIAFGVRRSLELMRQRLNNAMELTKGVNPYNVLSRGFAAVYDGMDKHVKSVDDVEVGDSVRLCMGDGRLDCVVNGKTKNVEDKTDA